MRSVILSLAIAFCCLSSPVLGVEEGSKPRFEDVKDTDWFAPYVEVCAERGLLNGVGEGKFNPGGILNGDEALVMAARVLLARLALDAMSASRDFALLRQQGTELAKFLTGCGTELLDRYTVLAGEVRIKCMR